MSISRKHFETIAANLREAKMLGLFADANAHRIVVENLAHTFEQMNPQFDGERFATASGVVKVFELSEPRWDTAGTIRNGVVTTVALDEPEYVVDCD